METFVLVLIFFSWPDFNPYTWVIYDLHHNLVVIRYYDNVGDVTGYRETMEMDVIISQLCIAYHRLNGEKRCHLH